MYKTISKINLLLTENNLSLLGGVYRFVTKIYYSFLHDTVRILGEEDSREKLEGKYTSGKRYYTERKKNETRRGMGLEGRK